jgi:arylsulfatase A-like enzyme
MQHHSNHVVDGAASISNWLAHTSRLSHLQWWILDWNRKMSFATLMRDAGYKTCISGKWQINDLFAPGQQNALADHDFEDHCIWPEAKTGLPAHKKRYWDPYVIRNGQKIDTSGRFGPDVFTDHSIEFMSRHRDKPFLRYQWAILTHIPVTTTPHTTDENASGSRNLKTSQSRSDMNIHR